LGDFPLDHKTHKHIGVLWGYFIDIKLYKLYVLPHKSTQTIIENILLFSSSFFFFLDFHKNITTHTQKTHVWGFMGTFHIHHDFYTAHNDYSTPKPKTLAFSKHHLVCFISCFPLGDRMCIMVLNIAILVGTFCPHIVGFTWTTHTSIIVRVQKPTAFSALASDTAVLHCT